VRAEVEIHYSADDLIIEMTLPEIELPNLTLRAEAAQLVVSSDPNDDGLQLMHVIDLSSVISLDGLDAERTRNKFRITTALAGYYGVQRATA
jgi:HSP20 family molecular chaperone IbpA